MKLPRITDGQFAIGCLFVGFVWIFVVLPLLYYPRPEATQNQERAINGQQQTQNIGNEPPTWIALKLFTAAGRNEIAAYCGSAPQQQPNKWAHNYICETKITDVFAATFNALLVIVTVGLIIVGSLTIRKMRLTEERQLRAYLSAEHGVTGRQSQKHRIRFEFRPVVVNNGQTPASNVRILTKVDLKDSGPIPTAFDYRLSNVGLPPGSVGTIGPSKDKFAPVIFPTYLTREDLKALARAKKMFHVWGQVTYNDIFKIERHTYFSFRVFIPPNKKIPSTWLTTDQHNYYD